MHAGSSRWCVLLLAVLAFSTSVAAGLLQAVGTQTAGPTAGSLKDDTKGGSAVAAAHWGVSCSNGCWDDMDMQQR